MKKVIRLTETDLKNIIYKSVQQILKESYYDNSDGFNSSSTLDKFEQVPTITPTQWETVLTLMNEYISHNWRRIESFDPLTVFDFVKYIQQFMDIDIHTFYNMGGFLKWGKETGTCITDDIKKYKKLYKKKK